MTRCTARSWFILCFIFPHLQIICGFANHGELELMEKISILENKVSKMEENEEQLRATIHTLFETSATARQANSVPENTVNNLVNLFEYHQTGGKDICLKSKFRLCDGLEKVRPADSNRDKRLVLAESVRPAFTAYLDQTLDNLGEGQTIVYNRVLLNDGNAYNNGSGIFTCPVAGIYLFSWATTARKLTGGISYDSWVKLVVNGYQKLSAVAESRLDYDDNQGSNTAILRVNQGDQVWVAEYAGTHHIHGHNVERSTSFSGVLLYES